VLHVQRQPAAEVAAHEGATEAQHRDGQHSGNQRHQPAGLAGYRVVHRDLGEQRGDRLDAHPDSRRHERRDGDLGVPPAGAR
jgi:hypothetical protein